MLQGSGELIAAKVSHVSILGSACERSHLEHSAHALITADEEKAFLRPDPTHAPFAADMATAEFIFKRLQELGIQIVLVSRHTVYACSLNASLYDSFSWTNNDLACQLQLCQERAVEQLWCKATAPLGSERRGNLPPRCNAEWFAKTMCSGVLPTSVGEVWSSVTSLMMYDAVTIVAAVPLLRERIFSHEERHEHHCTNGRTHLVYGQTDSLAGVGEPTKLRNLLQDAALAGLSISPRPYPIVIFTDPGQDLDDELTFILLASLVQRKYVRPVAIVANLHPSLERARLAKGSLVELGLGHVPVAVGTDGGCCSHKDNFSETAFAYLAAEADVEMDADSMLTRVLMDEEQHSVLFLCISSLTDAAKFMRNHEPIFADKVRGFAAPHNTQA